MAAPPSPISPSVPEPLGSPFSPSPPGPVPDPSSEFEDRFVQSIDLPPYSSDPLYQAKRFPPSALVASLINEANEHAVVQDADFHIGALAKDEQGREYLSRRQGYARDFQGTILTFAHGETCENCRHYPDGTWTFDPQSDRFYTCRSAWHMRVLRAAPTKFTLSPLWTLVRNSWLVRTDGPRDMLQFGLAWECDLLEQQIKAARQLYIEDLRARPQPVLAAPAPPLLAKVSPAPTFSNLRSAALALMAYREPVVVRSGPVTQVVDLAIPPAEVGSVGMDAFDSLLGLTASPQQGAVPGTPVSPARPKDKKGKRRA